MHYSIRTVHVLEDLKIIGIHSERKTPSMLGCMFDECVLALVLFLLYISPIVVSEPKMKGTTINACTLACVTVICNAGTSLIATMLSTVCTCTSQIGLGSMKMCNVHLFLMF